MALLDDIKTVLGITDTSKDALLNIYINKGVVLITDYMNYPDPPVTDPPTPSVAPADITVAYPSAMIEYVTECYHKRGNEGIRNSSQGSRIINYEDSGLSKGVKSLLPSPYIRMVGVRRYVPGM